MIKIRSFCVFVALSAEDRAGLVNALKVCLILNSGGVCFGDLICKV